jgi:succinate-semialdehyde dehydrogenase / glutarate-semialdehyde dehydrogenase
MAMKSINPATGEELASYDELTDKELEAKLKLAAETAAAWRLTNFGMRGRLMHNVAGVLEKQRNELATMMTLEMGKTLVSAKGEVDKCALVCRYYAENASTFLADQVMASDASRSYARFLPLGVVLAVMPWNFPLWQLFRFAAPGLMAGNAGLLKHASNVPQCALAIEQVFAAAKAPPGLFQTLLIGSDRVASLLDDDRVAAATLTGSTAAGQSVASRAGQNIKKTVLELGGSDPFIVMPSARLEETVAVAVKARTMNNGQSCIAAKRFIVHKDIYTKFKNAYVKAMKALVVGDPMDAATDIGPLATRQGLADVTAQVNASVKAGAKLLCGGEPIKGKGYFYPPTVLADIPKTAPAFDQEVFGPVALLHRVKDIDAAIALANATEFGLGSSVWTHDAAEQRRFIDELEAGSTFINAMVASDPRLPFGGIKKSGYGRELSPYGIREFVNVKTIYIA